MIRLKSRFSPALAARAAGLRHYRGMTCRDMVEVGIGLLEALWYGTDPEIVAGRSGRDTAVVPAGTPLADRYFVVDVSRPLAARIRRLALYAGVSRATILRLAVLHTALLLEVHVR